MGMVVKKKKVIPSSLLRLSARPGLRLVVGYPPARHAGRQPSPADLRLAGQPAVRLRGLPQASPQVCKGVAYCSKDCQVCVASCLCTEMMILPVAKSKVGLAAAKVAALRINLNVLCWHSSSPGSARSLSRSPSPPLLLSHNLPLSRVY